MRKQGFTYHMAARIEASRQAQPESSMLLSGSFLEDGTRANQMYINAPFIKWTVDIFL